mgnify:CR=1 FL=1
MLSVRFFVLVCVLLIVKNGVAASLVPIDKAAEGHQGLQQFAYIARRCAALTGGMLNRVKGSGRGDMPEVVAAFKAKQDEWIQNALVFTLSEPAKQNTIEFLQESMVRTVKAYGELWDSNIDLTGDAFGDLTMGDVGFCNALQESASSLRKSMLEPSAK